MHGRTPVTLIEPNHLFREGLVRLLQEAGFDTLCAVSSVGEIRHQHSLRPDIPLVLLDSDAAAERIADDVQEMRQHFSAARIVALAAAYCPKQLVRSLRAGADGYLLKSVASEILIRALRLALLGAPVLPSQVTALIRRRGVEDPIWTGEEVNGYQRLSDREREILLCLAEGASNKVIARRLDITEATAKAHVKAILRKLRLENRTHAAVWAIRQGLSAAADSV